MYQPRFNTSTDGNRSLVLVLK